MRKAFGLVVLVVAGVSALLAVEWYLTRERIPAAGTRAGLVESPASGRSKVTVGTGPATRPAAGARPKQEGGATVIFGSEEDASRPSKCCGGP